MKPIKLQSEKWCICKNPKVKLTWGAAPFICANCNKPIGKSPKLIKKQEGIEELGLSKMMR